MSETNNYVDIFKEIVALRGIQDGHECEQCSGLGVKTYGSTATWRGGVGGQAMTNDVCDQCWGSGDKYQPWPSWRMIPESVFRQHQEKLNNDYEARVRVANEVREARKEQEG